MRPLLLGSASVYAQNHYIMSEVKKKARRRVDQKTRIRPAKEQRDDDGAAAGREVG